MNRLFTGNVYKYNMIYVLYDLHEFLFSIVSMEVLNST